MRIHIQIKCTNIFFLYQKLRVEWEFEFSSSATCSRLELTWKIANNLLWRRAWLHSNAIANSDKSNTIICEEKANRTYAEKYKKLHEIWIIDCYLFRCERLHICPRLHADLHEIITANNRMTESHLVWIIDFDTLLSRHQADEMIKITLVIWYAISSILGGYLRYLLTKVNNDESLTNDI